MIFPWRSVESWENAEMGALTACSPVAENLQAVPAKVSMILVPVRRVCARRLPAAQVQTNAHRRAVRDFILFAPKKTGSFLSYSNSAKMSKMFGPMQYIARFARGSRTFVS